MPAKPGPGRPLTLTDTAIARIEAAIVTSKLNYSQALRRCGIPASTGMRWMQVAREADERRAVDMDPAERKKKGLPTRAQDAPFLDLLDRVEQATGDTIAQLMDMLLEHASDPKNWQAVVRILAQLDPDNWRETRRTEVTGAHGGPVQTETAVLTPEQVQARLAGLMPVPLATPPPEDIDEVSDDSTG